MAKEKGYNVTLIYFWLDNVNLAIERVKLRVSEGGHNISEEIIKRRYYRGMANLTAKFITICDYWIVINNSSRPFNFVAEGQENKGIKIYNAAVWNIIRNQTNEKE